MADFFAFILGLYLDIKHWFKVRKRRKFEKENNLPKKYIWHPLDKLILIFFFFILISLPLKFLFFSNNNYEKHTIKKLDKIVKILDEEKNQFAVYPKKLSDIKRNNPLRKNIDLDYYKNPFVYLISKDSLTYTLVAIGKDQKLNTSDDIKIKN